MSSHDGKSIEALRQEIDTCNELVAAYDEVLTFEPDDEATLSEKANTLAEIKTLEKLINSKSTTTTHQNDVPPPPPKWDPTKHPKFRKQSPEPSLPPTDDGLVVLNVKDTVMAKWSGDKQFYEATVISKTGSASDPVYTVTFKIDNSTETKRSHEVRAMPGKKRKAEGAPAAVTAPVAMAPPTVQQNTTIITAAPVVDKTLIQKREPSLVSDGPTRMQPEKKKLKGVRPMETKKNNWQAFQASGPKKVPVGASKQKESQFRTPDAQNARVGVTGSGKPMKKDPARAKWVAGKDGNEDE
jgi:survival-of-motor-neuron-related-splicing factor 30